MWLGEMTLIRYKEDDDDPVKTLVGVYHKNGNTGAWSYLTEDRPYIPFGICDSTSTSTEFTVTVPGIEKLEDGVCCLVKNGVVTSASGFTLNVNGLGAKPSYSNLSAATRDTTIFNVAYTMLFIYDSTRVEGGCWICYRGYDANTNTIGYQLRGNSHTLPTTQKFYRYRLLFTSADGTHFVPANTSSSTNATSTRTVNQTPIDPFGEIVYYGTTTAIDANSTPSASVLWTQYTLTLGYSFNRTGAALVLDYPKPLYVKCAPQPNGSAIIDSTTPYVQALPNTADGKIYILLGIAYSATQIELLTNHPVYYNDGTGIRLWTGAAKQSPTSVVTLTPQYNQDDELTGYTCSKTFAQLQSEFQDGTQILLYDGIEVTDYFYVNNFEEDSLIQFRTSVNPSFTFSEVTIYDDDTLEYELREQLVWDCGDY